MKRSRNIRWSQLKVGIFVFISLSFLVLFILQSGSGFDVFKKKVHVKLNLNSANGLKEGDPVRMSGIDIGNVESISFPKRRDISGVEVVLTIDEEARGRIRLDSMAKIGTVGLLGNKFIEITPSYLNKSVIGEGKEIIGISESDFDRAFYTASNSLKALNKSLTGLEKMLNLLVSGEGSIGKLVNDPVLFDDTVSVIKKINTLIGEIQRGKGSVGRLFTEDSFHNVLLSTSKNADNFFQTLNKGNLSRLSKDKKIYADLKSFVKSSKVLMETLKKGNITRISEDERIYENILSLSQNADKLVKKLHKGNGTAARLINEDELYQEVKTFMYNANNLMKDTTTLVGNINFLVKDIKNNPGRYVTISVF
jgi:phospholipid/cholesterol/gamma-HCH transport system substrate-binding protein